MNSAHWSEPHGMYEPVSFTPVLDLLNNELSVRVACRNASIVSRAPFFSYVKFPLNDIDPGDPFASTFPCFNPPAQTLLRLLFFDNPDVDPTIAQGAGWDVDGHNIESAGIYGDDLYVNLFDTIDWATIYEFYPPDNAMDLDPNQPAMIFNPNVMRHWVFELSWPGGGWYPFKTDRGLSGRVPPAALKHDGVWFYED